MTRDEIARQLKTILRDRLLHGSDRPIDLDQPLREFDLDSLAFVGFMASVESAFGVQIPEHVWMEPRLTLGDFIRLLDHDGGGDRDGAEPLERSAIPVRADDRKS
jgi:acyl carrier protein